MKHATRLRLIAVMVLGLGVGLALRFDSVKSSAREKTAWSAESSSEYGRNKTTSTLPSSPPLIVSILQDPENQENALAIQRQGAVLKEVAQESVGVRFADFKVVIEPDEEELDVKGSFTLGATNNGMNLFKEATAIKVGSFSATIPAGSFKQGSKGKVEFKKLIECKYWDLFIRAAAKDTFEFHLELQGTRGAAKIKPEDVTLSIGDDGGTAKPAS